MKTISKYHYISLLILTSFFTSCSKRPATVKIDFNPRWQFAMEGDSTFLPVEVPGNVFLDLYNNKKIPHPYFGDNEKKVQWVSRKNWVYKREFSICSKLLTRKNINLVFEGLDTYAEVILNGKKILSADNMFRQWTIPVKGILRKINEIEVHFTSQLKIDSLKSLSLPYKFPDNRAFTRKAPYQYGWDWGPKLVTMGIWKDAYLEFYDGFHINNVFIKQNHIDEKRADLTAFLDIENSRLDNIEIEILNKKTGIKYIDKNIKSDFSNSIIEINFSIDNPKLWYPNGMGDQNIYELLIKVKAGDQILHKTINTGLRTVKLVQKKDSIGSSFYFEVNGTPLFIKGANYVPADNFPSTITRERYEKLISDATLSNMNMLRVWGGGVYESDEFYDLCDKYGILVWQDFMFACNFYPGDSAFVNNVEQEATQQIIRLRNHPSIALWCGNNEVEEAWWNWGYQKALNYSSKDSLEIWSNYVGLFQDILPSLVEKYSNGTSYISTSPKIGWGHKEALLSGDMHYWGVWWGEEPFEVYEKKVGRFMSEYGFQGFPDIKTLQAVLDTQDLKLDSPALLNHQKHPRGMQLINEYMKRDFPVPGKFDDYLYVSQLVQAYGISKAIEAHRRAKPYCMGTLYWQYNDSWPVISWSSRDYFGRWKALQYHVKKVYDKVIVSSKISNDSLDIYIVSDSMKQIKGNLQLNIMTFEGKNIYNRTIEVNINRNESKKIISLNLNAILPVKIKDKAVLNAIFSSNNKILAEKNIYFVKPKELELTKPQINIETSKTETGYNIILTADKLVKNIRIKTNVEGKLSDNFFDILPNRKYLVSFETNSTDSLEINYTILNSYKFYTEVKLLKNHNEI